MRKSRTDEEKQGQAYLLCATRGGPVRLGQLSRLLPEASKKVLMTELKQLVISGLVERRDLSDGSVARHVEYNLIDSIRPATFLRSNWSFGR